MMCFTRSSKTRTVEDGEKEWITVEEDSIFRWFLFVEAEVALLRFEPLELFNI